MSVPSIHSGRRARLRLLGVFSRSRRWPGEVAHAHAPLPSTAVRSAQMAIWKRRHSLRLQRCDSPKHVAPGGKRPVGWKQFLCKGRRKEPGQNPAPRSRALSRGQSSEVEEGLESFEQQLDLPTEAVQVHYLEIRRDAAWKSGEHPDDLAVSRSCGDHTDRYPLHGSIESPTFLGLGPFFWGTM